MYWAVGHLEEFRGAIETVQVAPLAVDAADGRSPLVHVDHTRRSARYYLLSLAVLSIGAAASVPSAGVPLLAHNKSLEGSLRVDLESNQAPRSSVALLSATDRGCACVTTPA